MLVPTTEQVNKRARTFINGQIAAIRTWPALARGYNSELFDVDMEFFKHADQLRAAFSWSVIDQWVLSLFGNALVKRGYSEVVEIGAGTGWWASALAHLGFRVHAYDSWSWTAHRGQTKHHSVLRGGPPNVADHPGAALMLCWPPLPHTGRKFEKRAARRKISTFGKYYGSGNETNREMTNAAQEAARRARKQMIDGRKAMAAKCLEYYEGDLILYVGEPAGGCCGEPLFWDEIQREWEEVNSMRFTYEYPGLHERAIVYERLRRATQ